MLGTIVNCTTLDSVRVEILGEGRAVTIPAGLIVAVDRVLRAAFHHDESLSVDPVEGDAGEDGWQAVLDMGQTEVGDVANSPWGAIVELARKLEQRR